MPSLTDEITSKTINDGVKVAQNSLKVAKDTVKKTKEAGEAVIKGICLLILDGGAFTTENVMKAVKNVAFKKTGDIKYSKNNIDIAKLRESGNVHKIDSTITDEVMHHFDEQCKKYGIKYSAMQDDHNPDKPAYMIFFEGKDSDMIFHVLQESYKDYMDVKKSDKRKGRVKQNARNEQKERESVKSKLAFFCVGLQIGMENGMR